MNSKKRFPAFSDLLAVFSVAAALVYGWTTVVFFWKLPSWLLILNAEELLGAFSYAMTFAMLESLLLTAGISAVCILPGVWISREDFVVRGSWLAIGGYGSLMALLKLNQLFPGEFLRYWWWASLAGLALTVLLTAFSPRVTPLRRFALWAADRFQVFLLILVPLSFLALFNVIVRNLS